ncbi:hypothetical protein C2G38_2213320 [Gigaspora rosea]|uniref:Uncharacterized protein n=1 Tax=Gigaspora rosea TaxID=44941 RepID=A0A397UC90_9GLOM|nr:hypothetical protein C2G38_2213320 [Gigaspora rosea]
MPEAQLCYLLLSFSSLHKPDSFHYCDMFNCFIFLSPFNTDAVIALVCSHTYHKSCYINNGFKCLYCLAFLQEGIDIQVQSLLESLKVLKPSKKQVKKCDNSSFGNDKNNERGTIKYLAFELEEVLQKFCSLHC